MHRPVRTHCVPRGLATTPVPNHRIIIRDLIEEVLVLLETSGEDRMAAMLCILGPAGESQLQAIQRLSTTLTQLRMRLAPAGMNA